MTKGRLGPTVVLALSAAAAAAGLWLVGRALPPPPLLHPARLPGWWRAEGPTTSAFAAARLGWILLVATALVRPLARGARTATGQVRLRVEGRSLPGLARLALGLSVSGGVVNGCGAGAQGSGSDGGHSVPAPRLVGPEPGIAPGRLLLPAPDVAPASTPPRAAPRPPAPVRREVGHPARPTPATWTVRPGDDFWSIAQAVVGAQAAAGVGSYWLRLMAANRDRLPDPANPNLLFAGDVLVLPPPPGSPA